MADDVILGIGVDTKKAVDAINSFEKNALKSLESINSGFGLLKEVAAAAVAFLGAREITDFLKDATNEAIKQENAINELNTALKLSGSFTNEASKGMLEYADSMQTTTVFSSGLIISQLALAKNLGATNDQAKQLTTAAANLSAATGADLETATRQLGITLSGTAGSLARTLPFMRGLTEQQLKAGEAIRIVNERFGGAAQAQVNTFGGSLIRLSNIWDDLKVSIGSVITQNPVFIEGIKLVADVIQKLTKLVSDNRDVIIGWVNDFLIGSLNYLPNVIRSVGLLVTSFVELLKILNQVRFTFDDFLKDLPGLDKVNTFFDKILGGVASAIGFDDFAQSLADIEDVSFDSVIKGLNDSQKAAVAADDSLNTFIDSINQGVSDAADYAEGLVNQLSKAQKSAAQTSNIAAGKSPFDYNKLATTISDALTKAIGFLFQGAAGVGGGLGAGAQGLATLSPALAPFAGAIGALVTELAKGPDFVKTMVNQFVDALPQVLNKLIDAIPVLIEVLVKRTPDIIAAFIQQIPHIITALADAAPQIIQTLIEDIPKIIAAFIAAIPQIISALIKALPQLLIDIIKGLGQGIVDAVKDAFDFLGKGGAGVTGSNGVLSKLNPFSDHFLKFATGLTEVPGGFPNDSYGPVALSSGERVVDSQTNADLKSFLAAARGGGANQPIVVNIQVGQDQLARAIFNLNKSGFRMA